MSNYYHISNYTEILGIAIKYLRLRAKFKQIIPYSYKTAHTKRKYRSKRQKSLTQVLFFQCQFIEYYIQIMREKSGKKGHRRQISKELIKRRLLEDLYPISRQKGNSSRSKQKSDAISKFTSTLEFIEFNKIQMLTFQKFQQKIHQELKVPPLLLENFLQQPVIDKRIEQMIKKLIYNKQNEEESEERLLFQLKNLVATAKKQTKDIVSLVLFFFFLNINIEQYKTVLRQFEERQIYKLTKDVTYPGSQLLTSKINSIILMILIKYNQTSKLVEIAQKTLDLRRLVQRKYSRMPSLMINADYTRTTLFFSLKFSQALLKHKQNPYQLLIFIQNQIQLAKQLLRNLMIFEDIFEIYVNQMVKIKEEVKAKVQNDYYHSKSATKVQIQNKAERVQSSLKEFKRKKSLYCFKKPSLLLVDLLPGTEEKEYKESPNITNKIVAKTNYREIYSFSQTNTTKYSKLKEGTLKKVRKEVKKSYQANQSINISLQTEKKYEKTIRQFAKQSVDNMAKNLNQQSTSQNNRYNKLNNLYKFVNSLTQQKLPTVEETNEKKRKIEQIYSAFRNENKIIRDIPTYQLRVEINILKGLSYGTKQGVKQAMYQHLINFSAGLENVNNEIDQILNQKSCNEVQFLKIWLDQFYKCRIYIQSATEEIILRVSLNDKIFRVILSRGSNVLCQRYLTIWPTIRYLVNKKLIQFNIIKKYEGQILTRKLPQVNLIHLQSDFYFSKFGIISKEEMEEINICLDSIFKLVLLSRHYYGDVIHGQIIKINEEIKYPLNLFTEFAEYSDKNEGNQARGDGFKLKLRLLTEIYLSVFQKINLFTMSHEHEGKYFLMKAFSYKDKLLNTLKNKSSVQICVEIISISGIQVQRQAKVRLQWEDLQKNYIFFHEFRQFLRAICTKRTKKGNFACKLIRYFEKQIIVIKDPIFSWKVTFQTDIRRQCLKKQRKQAIVGNFLEDYHFQLFDLNIIQSYSDSNQRQILGSKELIKKKASFASKKPDLASHMHKQIRKNLFRQQTKMTRNQLWQQQRHILGNNYLIILSIFKENIAEQWIAEYTVISRRNQSKLKICLNHLDLIAMFIQDQRYHPNNLSSGDQNQVSDSIMRERNSLLIELISAISFYCAHHIKQICFRLNKSMFKNSYKLRLQKENQNGRNLRKKTVHYSFPELQSFSNYCRLRVIKTVKANHAFGFLTFKRNFMAQHFFWEIILQFPRRHTHYVVQISEYIFTVLVSERQQRVAPLVRKNNKSSIIDYLTSNQTQQLLRNIKYSAQFHQEEINYKGSILNLFAHNKISVTHERQYNLVIQTDCYPMRERIIEYFDAKNECLYNVWVDSQAIQVQMHYFHSQIDQISSSSASQLSFLPDYKQETIGRIELSNAFRFYQMENKDTNQEEFYLKRVCKFYFQFVRQQRWKYHKKPIVQQLDSGRSFQSSLLQNHTQFPICSHQVMDF